MFRILLPLYKTIYTALLHLSFYKLSHHKFRSLYVVCSAPSHYLNQWWLDYRHINASLGLNDLKWAYDPLSKDSACQVSLSHEMMGGCYTHTLAMTYPNPPRDTCHCTKTWTNAPMACVHSHVLIKVANIYTWTLPLSKFSLFNLTWLSVFVNRI